MLEEGRKTMEKRSLLRCYQTAGKRLPKSQQRTAFLKFLLLLERIVQPVQGELAPQGETPSVSSGETLRDFQRFHRPFGKTTLLKKGRSMIHEMVHEVHETWTLPRAA